MRAGCGAPAERWASAAVTAHVGPGTATRLSGVARAVTLAFALAGALALAAPAVPARADDQGVGPAASAGGEGALPLADSFAADLGRDRGFLPSDVAPSDATSVTISRLASADAGLDGALVTFRGEVVGEPVRVAGGRWVQLESADASYVMVFMTEEQAAQIEHAGRYQVRGTSLQVTGVYRLADPQRMGDLDVTAYQVKVVDAGGPRAEQVDLRRLWVALALVAAGAGLVGSGVWLRRRNQ